VKADRLNLPPDPLFSALSRAFAAARRQDKPAVVDFFRHDNRVRYVVRFADRKLSREDRPLGQRFAYAQVEPTGVTAFKNLDGSELMPPSNPFQPPPQEAIPV
jgi:hypothetical protein